MQSQAHEAANILARTHAGLPEIQPWERPRGFDVYLPDPLSTRLQLVATSSPSKVMCGFSSGASMACPHLGANHALILGEIKPFL